MCKNFLARALLVARTIFLRLKPSRTPQQESRGERCHVTKLNHILIDTVATVATRRVDKHRTCVRGRRMRAKAAVRDLSGVNLEHARSLHGHLPGNYMVPYLQLRQPGWHFPRGRVALAFYRLYFAHECLLLFSCNFCCEDRSWSDFGSNRTDYVRLIFSVVLFIYFFLLLKMLTLILLLNFF